MFHKDAEGKLHGKEIIDSINVSIEVSRNQTEVILEKEEISPFKQIPRKLQMKKGVISKFERLASYVEEVKKDLVKHLGTYDMSITTSNGDEDKGNYLAGEYQSMNSTKEMNIETFLQQFRNKVEESSCTNKSKGKGVVMD